MSEFDNNNFNYEKNENETSNNEGSGFMNEEQKPTDYPRPEQFNADSAQTPPRPEQQYRAQNGSSDNYYSAQNFNSNQSGQRYYYGQNSQPYGRNTPNYVYYGGSSYQAPYNPQQNVPNNTYANVNNSYKDYTPDSEKNKKGKKVFAFCIALIAIAAIVLTVLSANGKLSTKKAANKQKIEAPSLQVSDSSTAALTTENGELTAAGVYEKIKESSVGVLVYSSNTTIAAGEGSGVIVGEDKSGKYTFIITCAHVVDGSNSVTVQLYDETKYDAAVVGSDARTDIAVLRISKTGLKAVEVGDSEKLVVGDAVYAIGNPGGVDFAGTFTPGMISAIARPISSEIGYKMICLQHTAAINPGNSGGALVNSKGQLIGINSSKIASTSYEGMGFAVPSKTFTEVYNEIIEHGYVTNRPKLGITYTPASASQTYSMIVGVKGLPTGSIVIQSINVDSSLAGKGVEVGDLITKVNGQALENSDSLPQLVEKSNVGDKLTLTICHIDKNYQISEFDVEVTLVEDKGEVENIEEATTVPEHYNWNPFGNYFGN